MVITRPKAEANGAQVRRPERGNKCKKEQN